MEKKTIFITEEQYKQVYETVLREALIVNIDLVKSIVKYLNKHFKPVKYDDINPDGDVIQPYAIQMLSVNGEPLQTISVDSLLGKVDNKFYHKIKNEEDRHRFFKQVIDDWINGNISREGVLSVNVIKEKKTLNEPSYLGEIIDISFRDMLKTPLVENNHHVTYIDEYVNVVCDGVKRLFESNRNLENKSIKFSEDDFAHIPKKFFTECNIIIQYEYSTQNIYKGGYNYHATIVEEDEKTKNIENLPINKRLFNKIYFEIVIDLYGNSYSELLHYLKSTLGHEMTHALQHIRMKMNHDESFTDENYLKSYIAYTKKASEDYDENKNDDVLKGKFASFLYYTDDKESKANISEFYNDLEYIDEDDINSREKINTILKNTKMWDIIDVMGHRIMFYNKVEDEKIKEKLISFYNEYFPQKKIDTYREFKRKMNSRWNNFYGGIIPKLINMIREKAKKGQDIKLHGIKRPLILK